MHVHKARCTKKQNKTKTTKKTPKTIDMKNVSYSKLKGDNLLTKINRLKDQGFAIDGESGTNLQTPLSSVVSIKLLSRYSSGTWNRTNEKLSYEEQPWVKCWSSRVQQVLHQR